MDWLRGSTAGGGTSSSWDEQLRSKLSQAASGARRLAEQAEQQVPQLGEQLLASVQSLSEQGGTSSRQPHPPPDSQRASRQAEPQPHVSPLQSELQHIGTQIFASAQNLAEQTGAALATTADKVVGGVSALGIPGAPGSGLLQATGDLGELGRSFESEAHALVSSSSPMERAQRTLQTWHARLTPEASGRETAAVALKALLQSQAIYILLKALARSEPGRTILRAAAVARPPSEPSPKKNHEEAGPDAKAGRLLLRILCRTSAAAVALLKQLVTLLADVGEESGRSTSGGKATSGEDLQWVLQLLCSSQVHANEVELNEVGQLREAVDHALAESCEIPTGSAAEGADTQAEGRHSAPPAGAEVWAAWPGDGCWYRASVKAVRGARAELAWLRPPAGEGGAGDAEFLSSTGAEDTLFTQIGIEAMVPVALPRPSPTTTEAAPQDEAWAQQLSTAETSSRRFRELRTLCAALAPAAASSSGAKPADAEDASFAASAAILQALRSEGERRAAELAKAAVECANSGKGCEEQLSTCHQGFELELGALREQQEALAVREVQLQSEREDLCAKLAALDEQLGAARSARHEAEERERQIRAAEERVENELRRELGTGEETGQSLSSWQRLLVEAAAASRDVEELLARRATSVREAAAAREELGARLPAVAAMCLERERRRCRVLEELLACWHTAVWGPGVDTLVRDATRLTAIRSLHVRAGGIVEHAWRESVQLAAEELGGGMLGADSEGMSRAAEKYRKMRYQLQGNLERLSKLEAACANRVLEAGKPSGVDVLAAAEFEPPSRSGTGTSPSQPSSPSSLAEVPAASATSPASKGLSAAAPLTAAPQPLAEPPAVPQPAAAPAAPAAPSAAAPKVAEAAAPETTPQPAAAAPSAVAAPQAVAAAPAAAPQPAAAAPDAASPALPAAASAASPTEAENAPAAPHPEPVDAALPAPGDSMAQPTAAPLAVAPQPPAADPEAAAAAPAGVVPAAPRTDSVESSEDAE